MVSCVVFGVAQFKKKKRKKEKKKKRRKNHVAAAEGEQIGD